MCPTVDRLPRQSRVVCASFPLMRGLSNTTKKVYRFVIVPEAKRCLGRKKSAVAGAHALNVHHSSWRNVAAFVDFFRGIMWDLAHSPSLLLDFHGAHSLPKCSCEYEHYGGEWGGVLGLEEEPTDWWVSYTCEQRNSVRDEKQNNRNVFKTAFSSGDRMVPMLVCISTTYVSTQELFLSFAQ